MYFEYVEEELEAPRPSFSHVLPVAGMRHIMHNAAADMLTTSMKKVEAAVDQLAEVMRFLTNSEKRDRMLETCFDDAVGRSFHFKIKRLQGKVHKKRWGTVACCTSQILELGILCQRWYLHQYKADLGRGRPLDDDDAGGGHSRIEIVDRALKSMSFWCFMVTANCVYKVIRWCFAWHEGCPCHTHLLMNQEYMQFVPGDFRRRWEGCPCRAARLPEIAAGDFLRTIRPVRHHRNRCAAEIAPGSQ